MDEWLAMTSLHTYLERKQGFCKTNIVKDAMGYRIGGDGPNFIEAASQICSPQLGRRTIFTSVDRGIKDPTETYLSYTGNMEHPAKHVARVLPVALHIKFGSAAKHWFFDKPWEAAHRN